jgi:hypothetical protein
MYLAACLNAQKFSSVNRADVMVKSWEAAAENSIVNGVSLPQLARNTTVNTVLLLRRLRGKCGAARRNDAD